MSALALLQDHPPDGRPLAWWRADEWARPDSGVIPSGHAGLDAELPGGGWPCGGLVEIGLDVPGTLEWRLLLPALRQALDAAAGAALLLAGPPAVPHLPALQALGLATERLHWVRTDRPEARAWAAEQALRSQAVAAVLAWLPASTRFEALRRLQLACLDAAAQTHASGAASDQIGAPLCVLWRPLDALQAPSPAPLRLSARSLGPDGLELQITKRRGPPMTQPLRLAWPPRQDTYQDKDDALDRLGPASADPAALPARARIRRVA